VTFSIRNHVLLRDGAPVAQVRTPNVGGALRSPTLLVMHYTAGFTGASAIATLIRRESKASAHLVIDRDGTVTQLAPFNVVTWHAGVSKWKGRSGCNSFSIGIELVNCGPVKVRADKKLIAEVAPSRVMDPKDCAAVRHPNGEDTPFWQVYPEPQMEVAIAVARVLFETYGLKDIAGHYDIAPTRKRDPGPAFPMASFKAAVFGRSDDDNEMVRIATKKGVVEKPREELTAKDLLAAGSETIGAVVTAKRAVGVGFAAGGITAGSVASEPEEALQQVQTTAQTLTDTAQAVSTAKDSVSALADVGHWFATHWIVVLVAAAVVSIGLAFYYIWRAAQVIEQRRVSGARSGTDIGRLL
jgi:N-acetylmuramoyl-L-alanine amidase